MSETGCEWDVSEMGCEMGCEWDEWDEVGLKNTSYNISDRTGDYTTLNELYILSTVSRMSSLSLYSLSFTCTVNTINCLSRTNDLTKYMLLPCEDCTVYWML